MTNCGKIPRERRRKGFNTSWLKSYEKVRELSRTRRTLVKVTAVNKNHDRERSVASGRGSVNVKVQAVLTDGFRASIWSFRASRMKAYEEGVHSFVGNQVSTFEWATRQPRPLVAECWQISSHQPEGQHRVYPA